MNSRSKAAAALAGARLQRGEEVAVEAAAVRERLVRLASVVRQHRVGEVVVLVDQHVQRDVVVPRVPEQLAELAVHGGVGEDAADGRVGKQVRVPLQSRADLDEAVGLEAFAQGLEGVVEGGEVEAQDDVARPVVGGPPPDVGAVEDGVPLVGAGPVVVVLEHRHPEALAEAPGPDQEGVALLLEAPEEAGLVDIQPAPETDASDVGLAVGNAGVGGGHRRSPDPAPSAAPTPSIMPHAATPSEHASGPDPSPGRTPASHPAVHHDATEPDPGRARARAHAPPPRHGIDLQREPTPRRADRRRPQPRSRYRLAVPSVTRTSAMC